MFDILAFLFQNYVNSGADVSLFNNSNLLGELEEIGFSSHEICQTTQWLGNLADNPYLHLAPDTEEEPIQTPVTFRVLNQLELTRLDQEVVEFLLVMEQAGALNEMTRELVIDGCMALATHKVTLTHVKYVALLVLMAYPVDDFITEWLEDFVLTDLDNDKSMIH